MDYFAWAQFIQQIAKVKFFTPFIIFLYYLPALIRVTPTHLNQIELTAISLETPFTETTSFSKTQFTLNYYRNPDSHQSCLSFKNTYHGVQKRVLFFHLIRNSCHWKIFLLIDLCAESKLYLNLKRRILR